MRRRIALATCARAACGNDRADLPARFSAATTTVAVTTTPTTSPPTSTTRPGPTTTTLAPTRTRPPLPVREPPPVEDGSTVPLIVVGGSGHGPGTALPGELGDVVLAGHRVSQNADFRGLDQLAPGDEAFFTTRRGRRHVYHVASTEIVGREASWIVDQSYARTATLFACHPPGSMAQRIVVHLELV